MNPKVIFVDDEQNVLDGLKRMLRDCREKWDMKFVTGGAEALVVIARDGCDIVVTDYKMPGMNGMELLNTIMEKYPNMKRVFLTGQSDREVYNASSGTAHRYLDKPCDAETIKKTIEDLLKGEPS